MRTKLVTLAAVGALAVGGAAVAGTAIAATGDPSPAPTPGRSSAAPAPGPGAQQGDPSARQQRIREALAGLVADKTLTQEQADKVAERLAASGPALGKGRGGPFGRGHGHGHGPKAGLSAAATALGLTEADLRAQLRAGKSLATVAKEKGVAVEKVVDALVAEAQQRLADAVKAGRLTQAQADERLKDLRARITERVNATRPQRPGPAQPPAPAQPSAPAQGQGQA